MMLEHPKSCWPDGAYFTALKRAKQAGLFNPFLEASRRASRAIRYFAIDPSPKVKACILERLSVLELVPSLIEEKSEATSDLSELISEYVAAARKVVGHG